MRIIVFIFLLGFSSISMQAQQVPVPNQQTPLIIKITASWCPYCGTWGWSFFDDIYNDNVSDAVFMAVHHSGDHTNPVSSALTSNFNVFGQPRFLLDGVDENVNSVNVAEKRTQFADLVDEKNSASPSIQTGIDAGYAQDQITVSYSVKTFEDLNGDYYLGLYLVERTFVGYQASVGQDALHKTVLRAELTNSNFGNLLFSGSAVAGTVFDGYIEYPLDTYDPAQLQIVSVIWRKVGSDFLVINSNLDDELEQQTTGLKYAVNTQEGDFMIYPSVTRDQLNLQINASSFPGITTLDFTDLSGQRIYSRVLNAEGVGNQVFTIQPPVKMNPGIYLVHVSNGNRQITKKVIFE